MAQRLESFINEYGQVTQWPSRHALKYAILAYLVRFFEENRDYTEHEVNDILEKHHTFGDYFILRRSLIEGSWLMRTRNGARYWKNPQQPPSGALLEDYLSQKQTPTE